MFVFRTFGKRGSKVLEKTTPDSLFQTHSGQWLPVTVLLGHCSRRKFAENMLVEKTASILRSLNRGQGDSRNCKRVPANDGLQRRHETHDVKKINEESEESLPDCFCNLARPPLSVSKAS